MGKIRCVTRLWVLSLMLLLAGGPSFSYAQWTDCGGNRCTTDKVGIGTTSPAFPLQVESAGSIGANLTSNSTASYLTFSDAGSTDAQQVRVGSAGDHLTFWAGDTKHATITSRGDVGIGTANPSNYVSGPTVHIKGASPAYTFEESDGTSNNKLWDLFANAGQFRGRVLSDDGTSDSDWLMVRRSGATISSVSFPDGNVGIGTPSPTAKLHVAGDAKFDGAVTGTNIAAQYQDVAEWVPTSDPLASGTVVVIDPIKNNRVLPSAQPYDTRVAGVVSARPGILLGEAGNGKAKVAHSGRVKVKVDAQNGSIEIGDILVTSATTGYAMRSAPVEVGGVSIHRPGTILGKALEPLRDGKEEILVLLTLQ